MCAACGCGKKKGEPGFGKGKPKAKKACTCGTCKSCKSKKTGSKPLTGKQAKLDTDKDGKLEGSDFAALRKKKK